MTMRTAHRLAPPWLPLSKRIAGACTFRSCHRAIDAASGTTDVWLRHGRCELFFPDGATWRARHALLFLFGDSLFCCRCTFSIPVTLPHMWARATGQ